MTKTATTTVEKKGSFFFLYEEEMEKITRGMHALKRMNAVTDYDVDDNESCYLVQHLVCKGRGGVRKRKRKRENESE